MIKHKENKPAFTIIEVVLVLAIAGLIFLMVFIALPALQRSQRDAQRKQDISHLQDAVERYKANNRGQIPWPERPVRPTPLEVANFWNGYLNRNEGEWQDPSGIPYGLTVNHMGGVVPGWRHPGWKHYAKRPNYNQNLIFVDVGSECNGNTFRYNNQPNSYVILYGLEGGGSVCVDGWF